MYKLTGVTKLYHKDRRTVAAVAGLDLIIGDGEWLAVQGRTGHGKTTLLNLLGGLDRPTDGTVELDGTGLGALRETRLTRLRAEKIGFIFQTFNLIPTLPAAENVEAALIPLGGQAGRRHRTAAALDARRARPTGRTTCPPSCPAASSSGSRSPAPWSRSPKVLLADEPTGNLDEDTRDDIIALLEHLWRDRGLTLILVTHDTSVARRAQRVGVMSNGQPHHQGRILRTLDGWGGRCQSGSPRERR